MFIENGNEAPSASFASSDKSGDASGPPHSVTEVGPSSPVRSPTVLLGFLRRAQACLYLNITIDQLKDLVQTRRLRALRDPAGHLCFSVGDLDAIPTEVAADVAVAELTNNEENSMLIASGSTSTVASATQETASNKSLDAVLAILEELRRLNAQSPQWMDIDAAVSVFGVPAKNLREWASQGFVLKSKLGPALQSKSLYCAADIHDCLCRIAIGKQPVNAARKGVVG